MHQKNKLALIWIVLLIAPAYQQHFNFELNKPIINMEVSQTVNN
ncbi:hypothetical protein [Acinetobacter beijerinckii]|uniref:Uncharacterized protein n=1 Tax=Acinetobacter beijerinckii ANC 3835 TaxID=1217649 RepID=N9E5G2_9GAMM|nr:hypothetical protein [Acinetobacter beijerinckii]ENW05728.1 hypothetical protein F934_01085 [Acinetobacter beijerinckii ANC 3835]